MRKVFLILCLSVILPVVRASAGEVKLTTYYPSPYGEYTRMATKTLGVGDTNHDGKVSMTDAPDPATNPGDAIIAGNIYMQKGIYYGGGTCNGNGDVDGNGQITPLDVLCIINWINNGTASGMTPAEFARADIGGDGSVNAVDCYALIQWINSGHSEVMPTSTNPPKSLLPRIWPSALGTTWTGTLTAGTPWVVTYTGFQIGATCSDWFTLRQQPGLNVFGATNFYNSVIMNRYANLKYIGGTGDVDGNGLIQALDVDYIASYLTGSSLTPLQYARADVNHDGIVDQADADMIIAAINAGGAPEAVNTEVPVNVPNRIYYRPISAGYDGSVSLPGDFAVRSGKVGIGTTVDATAVLNVKGRIK
ncbi:MAG: dockerin type I domain-containing protein, partial [Candidatus Omnitrophota bacterium]